MNFYMRWNWNHGEYIGIWEVKPDLSQERSIIVFTGQTDSSLNWSEPDWSKLNFKDYIIDIIAPSELEDTIFLESI